MVRHEILETIYSIIKEINPDAKIKENTALLGENILDSLEFMNYLTKVERNFNIKINDSDVQKKELGIIEKMADYLTSQNK